MATYGEFYYKMLERINVDYMGLHNLSALDVLDRKIKCYSQFGKEANKYY